MKRNFFFIVLTSKKEYIPRVVQTFTFDGRPVFRSGSDSLRHARFFNSFDDAQLFMVERVLPFVDTKMFSVNIVCRSISFE